MIPLYPIKRHVAVGALSLLTITLASLQIAAEETLQVSRTSAVEVAFANNRELKIAVLEVARAKAELRWSGRLDNPELEMNFSDDGVGLDDNEGVFEVAFTQSFPITSRLMDERRVRGQQVVLAEAEIADRRRELAGEVDLAAVELIATRAVIARQKKLSELNQEIVGFLSDQVELGQISRLDLNQAKLTGRSIEQAIQALKAAEKGRELALKTLMGIEPQRPIRITSELDLPDASPSGRLEMEAILARRPDFILAVSRIDEAEAEIILEKSKRWEDVAVRLFAERERSLDEPAGLERNSFLGVGFSIPLPLRQRNQAGIETAEIDREAAEKTVDAVRFRIRSEYEDAFQQRLASWTLANEASGEVLDLAEENFAEFQKAYQQGQASLLQVQRSQEQQLELETAAIQTIADYYRADATLRLVTGDFPGISAGSQPSK